MKRIYSDISLTKGALKIQDANAVTTEKPSTAASTTGVCLLPGEESPRFSVA